VRTAIIIPARFKSSRFPGKPLAAIHGRASILWTIEAAQAVTGAHELYVATDSDAIRAAVEAHGARVIMTREECRNGTERVAEAAAKLGLADDDIVINFQGDAPLTPPWFIDSICATLADNRVADMVTPVLRCDAASYQRFVNDRKHGRIGATTAVFDNAGRALYFSKEVIPFLPEVSSLVKTPVFHHVGVYGFRYAALRDYPQWTVGPLETAEQLEQLRFLENGRSVYVVEVPDRGAQFWELNNPEDVAIIEAMMDARQGR
jgi:3-deoxy-manno-octulosonate cytidylyltransferase (CMP-KDO synthetase)